MSFHKEPYWLSALQYNPQLTGGRGGLQKLDNKLIFSFLLSAFRSDGELYSGTAYNFLGSEPIISRYSPSQSLLRTEYSTSWLNGE